MRSLVLALVLASGCTGYEAPFCGDGVVNGDLEECDDGNLIVGDGCSPTCEIEDLRTDTHVSVNWKLWSLAINAEVACPTGYDTVAVYAQPLNLSHEPVGPPVVELHDCASRNGLTAGLPRGHYLVWAEIVNSTNTDTYAKSFPVRVDTSYYDSSFDETIYTDAGYFKVSFTLVGESTGRPLSCKEAGVTGQLSVRETSSGAVGPYWFWNCDVMAGQVGPWVEGPHSFTINAYGLGSLTLTNQVIQAPNLVTDLGPVQIPITGL